MMMVMKKLQPSPGSKRRLSQHRKLKTKESTNAYLWYDTNKYEILKKIGVYSCSYRRYAIRVHSLTKIS